MTVKCLLPCSLCCLRKQISWYAAEVRTESETQIQLKKRGQAASVDVCLSPPATCGQQPPCRSSGKEEEVLRTYSRVSASFFWNSSSDSWLRRFLFRRLRREIDNNNIKSNKGIKKIVHTEVVHMQDWTGAGSHSLSSSFRSSKAPRSTRLIWFSIRWLPTETAQTENRQRKRNQKNDEKMVCSRVKSSSRLLVVSSQVSICLRNGQNLNSAKQLKIEMKKKHLNFKKKITKDWNKIFDIEIISQKHFFFFIHTTLGLMCAVTWPVISNKWPLWINSRPLPSSFIQCCQGDRCQ